MSKKAAIASGLALVTMVAMTGPAVAGDAGTQGGECQLIDVGDTDEFSTHEPDSVLDGDVSPECCTTECGIW